MTRTATAPQRGVLASFALLTISMMSSAQALAFDADGLSYSPTGANAEVTGRAVGNTSTVIIIPDIVSNSGTTYSVTSIGASAFEDDLLTSVTIGDNVESLGEKALTINSPAPHLKEVTARLIMTPCSTSIPICQLLPTVQARQDGLSSHFLMVPIVLNRLR